MQKENYLTVDQWCDQWFTSNRHKWNGNTEGGYRNLIYSHIIPSIGSVALSDLTKQTITDFYDSLRSQGLSARSVWCVHLLLRRCMDEAAQDQLIPYNPVRLCQEPKEEEYKTAPLRLGQLQRYLNAAEQLGVLPLIYTGLPASAQAITDLQPGDMVYVEGFGWLEYQGPNHCEYGADIYENGNKIGIMG